ncbi:MAG: molecular chaperone HtpG [Bacteroidota bacterium]
MQTGKINVQTENIFPIIKKFLYADHEIFLRELISNAVDATQKLKTLSSLGKFSGELGDLTIEVKLDKEAKTLSVIDRGIGMSGEEVEKFINQIAFSGAEEFIKKYKTDEHAIIGHFGLGFYSSFMVSERVEVFTKTFKKGAGTKAVKWECDGSPDYTLDECTKEDRGTEIVLHIAEDSVEFLEEYRVLDILKKYCKFLPVEIRFGTEKVYEPVEDETDESKTKETEKPRIINNIRPAWKIAPSELTDEDYKKFYHELYPMSFEEPLFNIHLNVDYPFNLTGILYFPKVKSNIEVQKNKIQLYCNQVFITDSVEGIVPEFLTLLHGVIDSPDIPLNVSRSYLQSDSNVKKISTHISKKVADKLEELFKENREDFEKKWDDIKVFIQYGMLTDDKFYDRAEKFTLLKNTENKYFTIEEYKEHIKALQTDKGGKEVILYSNHLEDQHSYIAAARERGFDVLLMDSVLDPHFINLVERKLENVSFKRVDAEIIDKLIEKEEALPSKLTEDEKNVLKPLFEAEASKEKYTVAFENLSETEMPVLITQPEFMRRMKDMSAMSGGGMMGMPDYYQLVVNANHPIVVSLLKTEDEEQKKTLVKQLMDIALLSQNLLKGVALTDFLKRSVKLIQQEELPSGSEKA